MEKASEAMYGNFYEAPWQPVREGIGRVVFAGAHAKGCTLALAECQNGNAVRPHTHPHAQLAIVLRGQCDYYVDRKPYRMKEGSWVFVPADVEHYIHVYDSDVPVMNLDVFFPERMEYVDAYDEFVAGLEEKQG